jgi:predicted ATPase/transcriptional regulator with XRE-family HTH domain
MHPGSAQWSDLLAVQLRRLRKQRGLSQEELAERAGVSVRSVTNIEGGAPHQPRRDTLQLLAQALELAPEDAAQLYAAAPARGRARADQSTRDERKRSDPPSTHLARHAPASFLPEPLTPLIGRAQEVAHIMALLTQPQIRWVTLAGLAGVGKTRLALAAARALAPTFAAGVAWIPLAPLRDPSHVLHAIAEAVGARETPVRSLVEALRLALAGQELLLLLDNLEHLSLAAPGLSDVLQACPRLKLLVTSRTPLGVRGEYIVDVYPLQLPDSLADPFSDSLPSPSTATRHRAWDLVSHGAAARLRRLRPRPHTSLAQAADDRRRAVLASPAIALFVERARAIRSSLELDPATLEQIATICRHLDGLPLAIELAAATARRFVPSELLSRLDHQMDQMQVLAGGLQDLPERQQSLHAALAWSYDLLPAPSQTLFRHLAVCIGGCSLETAQVLLQMDTREAHPQDGAQSAGLQDTVETQTEACDNRGAGRDERPTLQVVEEALAPLLAHQLARIEEASEASQAAPDREAGARRIEMLETVRVFAFNQLQARGEAPRVTAAHARYFLSIAESAETQLRGVDQLAALRRLDQERANLYVALGWCLQTRDARLGLRLASALGRYWEVRSLLGEGRVWLERLLALPDAITAPPQESAQEALKTDVGEGLAVRARALNAAAPLVMGQGDYAAASALLEEALALKRTLGDARAIAISLNNLGGLLLVRSEYRRAQAVLEESAALRARLGEERGVALGRLNLGILACKQGRARRAALLLADAERDFARLGDQVMRALALITAGEVAQQLGEASRAEAAIQEGLALARSAGAVSAIILALYRLADLARLRDATEDGLNLCDEALVLADEHAEPHEAPQILLVAGALWLECGELEEAADCVADAQARVARLGDRRGLADAALSRGRLAAAAHNYSLAQELYGESLALRQEIGTVAGVADCLEALAEAIARDLLTDQGDRNSGSQEELGALLAELGDITQRARDGAPALRSPREVRVYTVVWDIHNAHGSASHATAASAPGDGRHIREFLGPAIPTRLAPMLRDALAAVSTLDHGAPQLEA